MHSVFKNLLCHIYYKPNHRLVKEVSKTSFQKVSKVNSLHDLHHLRNLNEKFIFNDVFRSSNYVILHANG